MLADSPYSGLLRFQYVLKNAQENIFYKTRLIFPVKYVQNEISFIWLLKAGGLRKCSIKKLHHDISQI